MAIVSSVPRTSTLPGFPTWSSSRPGFLQTFWKALQEAQMHRAEAIVGRYIDQHGGRVTDSLEREIERRFHDV
jgi:hypothetical protein